MKRSAIFLGTLLVFTASLQAHDNYNIRSPAPAEGETISHRLTSDYQEIQTGDLIKLVQSASPSMAIVDARTIQNDNGKRIPSAKVIPVNAKIENITANLPDKSIMIVVYCSNAKCPASGLLAGRLTRMGYTNVWKYPGGIEEWEANGQKVEYGKTAKEAAAERGPKSA